MPHWVDGDPGPVLHVDGLHLRRNAVVLISADLEGRPVGWYVARTEHSGAWQALMAQTLPPVMVVTDGGAGFRKAVRESWPRVRIQRCLFHVQLNITALTSKRPLLPAGRELKELARTLLKVTTLEEADAWVGTYLEWERRWKGFLAQRSRYANGSLEVTHTKLVRARGLIRRLLREGQLFTFLDPHVLAAAGVQVLPATNNRLEGGINAGLRRMLDHHRGMPLSHRIKAIFWWCYTHSPNPMSPAQILAYMPTDDSIEALYSQARNRTTEAKRVQAGAPQKWGTAISWEDLHHKTWRH